MKFVKKMAVEMSSGNDKDGLGYAAVSSEGNLFGERWHVNAEAFKSRKALSKEDRDILDEYQGFLDKEEKYNSFGKFDHDNMTAITLHTRFATTGKEFYNTHPFVINNISLVHNGVIANQDKLQNKISSCDSECILNEYIDADVLNTPENIKKVTPKLIGWYACGVFGQTNEGQWVLDIFKEGRSDLYAFRIMELNTFVFTTCPMHVYSACKKLGLSISSQYDVSAYLMVRLDAITGKVIGTYDFADFDQQRQTDDSNLDEVVSEDFEMVQRMLGRQSHYSEEDEARDTMDGWKKVGNGSWAKVK